MVENNLHIDVDKYTHINHNLKTYKEIDHAEAPLTDYWSHFYILRGRDGYLYTAAGSGCSCDSFFDLDYYQDISNCAYQPLKKGITPTRCQSWIEACSHIAAWAEQNPFAANACMQLIERVADKKPVLYIEETF